MRNFLIAAMITAAIIPSANSIAADVGVSVSIGQPGFYGRIDIGDYPYPQPRVIYRQPRLVKRVYVVREPIYMRVPPGHARNWRKYCYRYDACYERVYFVQDGWYQYEFVPHYREQYRGREGDNHDGRRDKRRDSHHDD